MKILHVTVQLGRSYEQGTERYVRSLVGALRRRGHEVAVLAGDPLGITGSRKLGEPVDDELPGVFSHPTRGWMAVMGLGPKPLAKWIGEYRPDLVHVTNPAQIGIGAMVACRALGIPVVVTIMDFWWLCPKATLLRADGRLCDGTPQWRECVQCVSEGHARTQLGFSLRPPRALAPLALLPYVARSLLRGLAPTDVIRWMRRREFLLKQLDAAACVIFPSAAVQDAIRPQLAHARWRLVPYGLEDHWLAEPRQPRIAGKPPESLTIGYAGMLLPHKGPHLLLEAINRLGWRQTPVHIVGPFGNRGYGRRLRRAARGFDVTFHGRVPSAQMPGLFRTLDVLTVTSLWPENLPFVLLEAHAAGVLVIGSQVSGVADQITDPRLRFERGSSTALAAALEAVRETPEVFGIPPVQTVDQMTDVTERIYCEAAQA